MPLALGLYLTPRGQVPALLAMALGTGLWLAHFLAELYSGASSGFLGSGLPVPLLSMLCGLGSYLAAHIWLTVPGVAELIPEPVRVEIDHK